MKKFTEFPRLDDLGTPDQDEMVKLLEGVCEAETVLENRLAAIGEKLPEALNFDSTDIFEAYGAHRARVGKMEATIEVAERSKRSKVAPKPKAKAEDEKQVQETAKAPSLTEQAKAAREGRSLKMPSKKPTLTQEALEARKGGSSNDRK